MDSPLVDWTNDEAVVRISLPNFRLEVPHDEYNLWSSWDGDVFMFSAVKRDDIWSRIRKQWPTVVAYEKANNPAVQSPSSEAGDK